MITRLATTKPTPANSSISEQKTNHEADEQQVVVGIRRLFHKAMATIKATDEDTSPKNYVAQEQSISSRSYAKFGLVFLSALVLLVVTVVLFATCKDKYYARKKVQESKNNMQLLSRSLKKAKQAADQLHEIDPKAFLPILQQKCDEMIQRVEKLKNHRHIGVKKRIERYQKDYMQIMNAIIEGKLSQQAAIAEIARLFARHGEIYC